MSSVLKEKMGNSAFGLSENIKYLFNKAFFQFFRDLLYWLLLGKWSFPFFLGTNTKIMYADLLWVGSACFISVFA